MEEIILEGTIRSKRAKINIVAMATIKFISISISFFYVPLLVQSLNSVNYGIWLTITSLVSWISILDVGLGHGLRNKLSEALAKNDIKLGREYISTAYVFITILITILIIIFLLIQKKVNWVTVLNIDNLEIDGLNILISIVFIAFGTQLILNLINSIFYSLQMPAFSALISMIGQLLSFLTVLIQVHLFNIKSLPILGGTIAIIPPLVTLIISILSFAFKYKNLSPNFKYFNTNKISKIMSLGAKFFILQISVIFIYQTNNIIITRTLGPEYVTEYNIAYKYLFIVYFIFSIIITPIWSAATEAYIKKEFNWIKDTIKKLELLFLLSIGIIIVMILIAPYVYRLWLGDSAIIINSEINIAMGLAAIGQMAYGIYGYIINGIGKINLITSINIFIAIIYIPVCIILTRTMGLIGVCIMGFIVNIILTAICRIQSNKLLNEQAKGLWNQ